MIINIIIIILWLFIGVMQSFLKQDERLIILWLAITLIILNQIQIITLTT